MQAKAYTTRVGEGPYPTEIFGEASDKLREVGREYGTTTGRPRRVGWLDIPALKYVTRYAPQQLHCVVGWLWLATPKQLQLLSAEAEAGDEWGGVCLCNSASVSAAGRAWQVCCAISQQHVP